MNLDRGLIEISGVVKNPYRNRVIPVCSRTVSALNKIQDFGEQDHVISMKGPVIRTPRGGSYSNTEDGWRRYSRALRKKIREWNPSIAWAPKDLRNCLPTFAVEQGIHGDLWEQYLGHAPKTVTARHYIPRLTSVSIGESAALDRQMEMFRFHVVKPIEEGSDQRTYAKIFKNLHFGPEAELESKKGPSISSVI